MLSWEKQQIHELTVENTNFKCWDNFSKIIVKFCFIEKCKLLLNWAEECCWFAIFFKVRNLTVSKLEGQNSASQCAWDDPRLK